METLQYTSASQSTRTIDAKKCEDSTHNIDVIEHHNGLSSVSDTTGNHKRFINTEDKQMWCEAGYLKELSFVKNIAPKLDLPAYMHPVKSCFAEAYGDEAKHYPDLYVYGHGSDLKSVDTPFFMSKKHHNIDPQTAITFNLKDEERYQALYSSIHVYFYVDFTHKLKGYGVEIKPLRGIWMLTMPDLVKLKAQGKAPVHYYDRRSNTANRDRLTDDKGNATCSYVLDLNDLELVGFLDIGLIF